MSGNRSRSRAIAGATLAILLTGCAGAGQEPNSASSASVVPGAAPSLGEASQSGISVSGAAIRRTGTKLVISAHIHNSSPASDVLQQIGSQVSPTLTLSPPLTVPAGATLDLGSSGSSAVLDQQGRLEPGATVDLSLQFQHAGSLQVFTGFKDS